MFKVSLLPASYRKLLDGKKKKDIILKIALVGLLCMLIVYFGFYARTLILKGQLKDVSRQNSVVSAEINELQQYKTIYDDLVLSQNRLDSIKSKNPSALKFMTLIQSNRPEYVKIKAVALTDWQNSSVCVIEGELSAAQKIRDAVDHLRSYQEFLRTNEAFKDIVTEVKVLNEMPTINENGGKATYTFRIFVSIGGAIVMDEAGNLITTTTTTTVPDTTTTTTTTVPAETQKTESTTVTE